MYYSILFVSVLVTMSIATPLPNDSVDFNIPSTNAILRMYNTMKQAWTDIVDILSEELDVDENLVDILKQETEEEHDKIQDDLTDGMLGKKRKRQTVEEHPMVTRQQVNKLCNLAVSFARQKTTQLTAQGMDDTMTIDHKQDKMTLCDRSLVLFTGEVNETVRKDVTDSLVLAQLNADKRLAEFKSRNKDATTLMCLKEWFGKYQETFTHMSWVDTGYQVQEARVDGNGLSVQKVLLDIVESIGNKEEQDTFKKAIAALKGLDQGDNRLQIFEHRTTTHDITQLLVQFVYIDKRGAATMKSTMIGISTKQSMTNVLWFEWSDSDTTVYKTEHTMMLGPNMFDSLRPTVVAKVAKINATYINDIAF